MKTTLYNIQQDYLSIIGEVEEMDGELTPELEQALKINEAELQSKSIAYLEVIKTKEAFNGNIDNEIKRLQAIKKRNNTLVDNLNDRLLHAVNLFGDFTIGTVTFTTRKSKAVFIEDEKLLDSSYFNIREVMAPDKARIKKDIEDGIEVNGASIIENTNLRIK